MILIINLGSTTLKYQLRDQKTNQILHKNKIETQIPINESFDWQQTWLSLETDLINAQIDINLISEVLHRVVFGPMDILLSQEINRYKVTSQLLDRLDATADFAPLHNPVSLSLVRYIGLRFKLTQFLVFDNYLYRDISATNYLYAVPEVWQVNYQLRRYGYHGLAHLSIKEQLKKVTPKTKILSIQLGGGCSITAFDNDLALVNSMSFGTGEGLIMATRSGDVDSGAVLHLLNQPGLTIKQVQSDLQHSSGLLAIAGSAYQGDMRLILANLSNERCKLAIEIFVDRIIGYIGNYWVRFNGFEIIAFGGGIGEGSDVIRSLIINRLKILGVSLSQATNIQANEKPTLTSINDNQSTAEIWVVPVDEASVM